LFFFNRKYQAKNAATKSHKLSATEQLWIGINVFLYFISFFMIVFLFENTFISLKDLLGKFGFFLLIALTVITFYLVSKGLLSKIASFALSFGVLAPIALAIYLSINFYFTTPYISETFKIPNDFEIDPKTNRLSPILGNKFFEIPHLQKMDFPVVDVNFKAQSLYIKIDKGLFGYFVIKEKKFIEP
jgi:hypothetical protein